MDPIRAKFAGTCDRTGQPYSKGDLIVRLSNGKWARAQDKAGNLKTAPPAPLEPEYRAVRLPNGTLREHVNVAAPSYCGDCLKADGLYEAAQSDISLAEPYRFQRVGDDFVCSRCAHRAHILSDQEVWEEVTLPALHLTREGTLSHKVGPAMWVKIKHMYEYISYADLAEAAEDQDNFDEAREYEEMGRGGEWFLKHPYTPEQVEQILGILPHNRRAVLDGQEAEEKEAAKRDAEEKARQKRERDAAKDRLFGNRFSATERGGDYIPRGEHFDGRVEGVRVRWGSGHTIYGGGEEFRVDEAGQCVWLIVNNGADGDDWSLNNVGTGGAGAIGFRFPLTPERIEFLRHLPGGDRVALSQDELRARTLTTLNARVMANADETTRAFFPDLPRAGGHPTPAFWTKLGDLLVGLTPDHLTAYLCCRNPSVDEPLWDDCHEVGVDFSDNVSRVFLHYTPTPEAVAAIRATWPDWAGTSDLGRYILGGTTDYVCDNAADAVRIADVWRIPLATIHVTPGVTLTHVDTRLCQWSDGKVTRLGSSISSVKLYHSRREWAQFEAMNAERIAKGETPYTYRTSPDQNRYAEAGFPALPPYTPVGAHYSETATRLVQIAMRQAIWREQEKYRDLLAITEIEQTEALDHAAKSGHGGGWDKTLHRLLCRQTDGNTHTLYRVDGSWGYMGEDGNAGEDNSLYDNEADARAAYATLYQ